MDGWLILDRDGVINFDSDQFIKSPDEWQPLPGSLEAIAKLNAAGYRIVVISNQSGLARDLFDNNTLESIHQKFIHLLAAYDGTIERIYICPHGPDDHCDCRKPLPGLFIQFAEDFSVDLGNVYAIGDSLRDLQAAHTAGARPILVRTGKGFKSEKMLQSLPADDPISTTTVHDDLWSFTESLINKEVIM